VLTLYLLISMMIELPELPRLGSGKYYFLIAHENRDPLAGTSRPTG